MVPLPAGSDDRCKGPQGQKRPADVIGNAVKVMRIATGEEAEEYDDDGKNKAAVELGRRAARRGLLSSAKQRSEIARKAAARRWAKE